MVKNPPANTGVGAGCDRGVVGVGVSRVSRGVDPWVEKTHLRRKRQSTPAFLPGKSQKRKSLAGYSPWYSNNSRTRLGNWKCGLSHFSRVELCGSLWTRILEWVAMPPSRGSSQLRDQTCISFPVLAGCFFTTSAVCKAHLTLFLHIRRKRIKNSEISMVRQCAGLMMNRTQDSVIYSKILT